MVALVQFGNRLAAAGGIARHEIQGRPVPGAGAFHFFFGQLVVVPARMNQRAVGLGLDQPVLQVARHQRRGAEARLQGGQRLRRFTDVFLQLAAGVDQVVLGLDQVGLGQVATGYRLIDVGDGAGTQLHAPLRRRQLLFEGIQLGLGQGDGFAGQQHVEVSLGQAHRGVLALGIEHRHAVVRTLLALTVFGHLLLVEQRLAQPHVGALGVIVQVAVPAILTLAAIDPVEVARSVDLRQQAGLADGAVLAAGFFLVHRGAVDRALVLQQVPGLLQVHGTGLYGQPQKAKHQAPVIHSLLLERSVHAFEHRLEQVA
ncbi:hypothetical protein D3C81_1189930 [compost metagenome]